MHATVVENCSLQLIHTAEHSTFEAIIQKSDSLSAVLFADTVQFSWTVRSWEHCG